MKSLKRIFMSDKDKAELDQKWWDDMIRSLFAWLMIPIGPVKSSITPDGKTYSWSTRADDKIEQELRGQFPLDEKPEMARLISMFTVLLDRHPMSLMIKTLIVAAQRYAFPDPKRNHPIEILLRAEIASAKDAGLAKVPIYDRMIEAMHLKQNIEEASWGNAQVRRLRKHKHGREVLSGEIDTRQSGSEAPSAANAPGESPVLSGPVDAVPGFQAPNGGEDHAGDGQRAEAIPGD